MSLPEGVHYGLLAQEVAPVLPTLVKTFARPAVLDSNQNVIYPQVDHLSINYEELIPILIQAVKEQQAQIDSLILALNPFPTPIKKSDIDNQERQHITLSDQQGVILNQNDPNPFAEHTVISYVIPENIVEAKIIFFTATGAIVQQIKIHERGAGELDVYASDLSSGIYTYSLIADGKVMDTKRMLKSK